MRTIKIDDVTTITDRLLERSSKFAAFFSRAELEAHVAFVMAPHYEATQSNIRIVERKPIVIECDLCGKPAQQCICEYQPET